MKIVMIGQKGIPTKSGGIEKHVESLAIELTKLGHEIIVYTRPYYTDKNLSKYKGVKLISLPSLHTKHLDAASHTILATLHALLMVRNIDIIHYHGIGPSMFLWLPRILNPRLRVFSTFHCQDYYHQKWSFVARTMLKLGELCSIYLPHKTIVVSKGLKRYVDKKYNRKSIYIPNGTRLLSGEKSFPTQSDKESLTWWRIKPKGYILTVSRLVRHKGIHTLINAYKKLDEKTQKTKKLVIVGDTAFTDDYVKELKLISQNNPNIIFTGQQTGRALRILFQNAYLFVHPSESEGLSLSLLEALGYGLPILSSDIPANLELVRNCGFIFKKGNREDLYKKLSLILDLPASVLNKKAHLAKKRVAQYDWKKIAKRTEKIYEDSLILAKSRIALRLKAKKA